MIIIKVNEMKDVKNIFEGMMEDMINIEKEEVNVLRKMIGGIKIEI